VKGLVAAPFVFLLVLAACGGANNSAAPTATAPSATATEPATVPAAPPVTETGVLPASKPQPPLTASLTASGHRPVAGEQWTFSVKAKNKNGAAAGGTVRALLLLNGKLYDTIGWFAFRGALTHSVTFPLERKDLPLVFRAQIVANGGVTNLDYPIKVR
jgi:hypothetical protein